MSKEIRIQTTVDVSFDTMIDQAVRFAKLGDNVTLNALPKKTDQDGKLTIAVSFNQPLHTGFNGQIRYIQHYQVEETYQEYDIDNPTVAVGVEQKRTVDKEFTFIKYNQFIPVEDVINDDKSITPGIQTLIDQVMPYVPSDVNGYLARQDAALGIIIKANITSNKTLNLADDQWIRTQ